MPSLPLRLVVLDRDGVINRESPDFIKTEDEWIPITGSLSAIADLGRAGFTVVVASNQSGVGRGLLSAAGLVAINAKMIAAVEAKGGHLAGIFTCPHHPGDGCDCRKPKPGLLREIERTFRTSLAGSPVIGDSTRDIEAGRAVGARTILVRTGNGRQSEAQLLGIDGLEVFDDLAAAARKLVDESS